MKKMMQHIICIEKVLRMEVQSYSVHTYIHIRGIVYDCNIVILLFCDVYFLNFTTMVWNNWLIVLLDD